MQNSPHLRSDAYEGAWGERVSLSVAGMAHFAKTGPEGTDCRQCAHWGRSEKFKRDGDHKLRRRTCQKFLRMCAADTGPAVEPETPSCRHFVARENPPALVKVPERKTAALPIAAE